VHFSRLPSRLLSPFHGRRVNARSPIAFCAAVILKESNSHLTREALPHTLFPCISVVIVRSPIAVTHPSTCN
jgi:hypothetical protein